MKLSAFLGVLIFIALIVGTVFYMRDTTAPLVALSQAGGPISARGDLTVTLKDAGAGLKKLTVSAQQGERKVDVLVKQYPAGTHEAREKIDISGAGLHEGPLRLQLAATDHSIFHFGSGNTALQTHDFSYDNKPPAIAVLSVAHNIAKGGVGLVVYTLSKEVSKTGVVFADRFYPGYRQSDNFYACLFPWPFDMPPEKFQPRVLAVDRAGNQRLMGMYYHLLPKVFSSDTINLNDTYLQKVAAEFQEKFPRSPSPLETFLKVNRDLRSADAKILYQSGLKTAPVPLWEGTFLRLPNAAPRGGYAQARTYIYQGKKVDQQTHLGFDLASLPHAAVPAANSGKVVYADFLDIYGQCVIIDHGMGLQTLYGHLSRIGVKAGDAVKKGDVIGNTGDTGLAAGDHLHYGVLVTGEQVNPVEWWDPSWIKNNITSKLEIGKTLTPSK